MFRLPASLGGAPLPEVEIIEADTESFDRKLGLRRASIPQPSRIRSMTG
jgi:hypothetical protein